MKKVLSVFLVLIIILSVGTVGVSSYESNDYIWIQTSRLGAKVDNYLYFPVYYDDDSYLYTDEDEIIRITFPFTYDPEILKPVEVTPSEALYGMNFKSEISRVDVYTYIDEYGVEITYPYFYADITFDGGAKINNGEVLFNVKMEIIGETTSNSGGPIFDSFFLVEDLEQEKMTCCKWEVVDKSGKVVRDMSSKIQHNYRLDIDDTDDNLTLNNYEPFIPSTSSNDYMWISTSRYGAQIDNYLYFPVFYDDDQGYARFVDENSTTKIVFPFFYDPEFFKPVDVTPSEQLYGMNFTGEISVIDVYTYISKSGHEITYPYFYVEITFDGGAEIEQGDVLFNVKLEIISETASNVSGELFDSYFIVEDLENSVRTCAKWEITDGNGTANDISSQIQHNYRLYPDDTDDNLTLNNYEPFIPPVEEEPLFKTGVTEKHIRKDNAVYYPIRFDGGEGVSYAQFRSSVTGKETGVCRTKAVMKFIYDANTVEFIDTISSIGLHLFSGDTKVLERGSTGETGPDGQEYDYIVVELNVGNINISDDYSFFYLKFYVLEENFLTEDGKVRTVVANADYEKAPGSKGCIWQFNDDSGVLCDLSTRVYLYDSSDYPEVSSYNDLLIDEVLTGDLWETGLSLTTKITPAHGRIDNFVYYPCEFIPGKYYSDIVRNMTGFDDGSTQVKMKISYDARVLEFIDVLPSKELYDIGGTVTVIESGVMNPVQTYFEYVIIQVDFDGFTGLDNKYLYSLKFNVLEEKFVNSSGRPISYLTMERFSIDGVWSHCHWTVTGTNGRQFDLTELTASKSTASFDSTITYNDLIIEGYEPFDPTLLVEEKMELVGGATVMTQGGVNYIVGLQPNLTKTKFQSTYIDSENVTVEINMSTARYLGTGSTVTVKSAATGEVVAEYVVVIYGDVDGTATINARDAVAISNSVSGEAATLTGAAKLAANVEGTRATINAKDASVIRSVAGGTMIIDQSTGKGIAV